ncbi:MAG: DUF86 domain-containing protein [Halospina sp.]
MCAHKTQHREWRFYLSDMLEFAQKAVSYTEGLNQEKFVQDTLTYDATLRNLELIGEAATKIPDWVQEDHPEIPWRKMIATRNRLIHAYLGIDNDIVWSIVCNDLPELIESLEEIC